MAVAAVGVAATRDGGAARPAPSGLGPQGRVPQFVVECGWSHTAADDPIVHPGHAGAAHVHDFFGNTTTAAHSTHASLLAGDTTCGQKLDTAAYWAPALSDHGTLVRPLRSIAYYRPGPDVDPARIRAFPPGLVMIGGNPDAGAQSLAAVAWRCGASPRLAKAPPVCPERATLTARVVFPDCWDGRHTDSPDHRDHVATSTDGTCPASHPVPIPQLTFDVHYPIHGDGHTLTLASGGTHTFHADFVNAWDQPTLEREVHACLNRANVCGVVSNRATG